MFANVAKFVELFAKFQKFQLDNLVDFEKCCKTRIYYLLAKIGADTAENEHHFAEILPIGRRVADRCPALSVAKVLKAGVSAGVGAGLGAVGAGVGSVGLSAAYA